MRAGHQRRCWPHLYMGFLCIALGLYAIANSFSSSFRSVKREDASAVSPYLLFSAQRHCRTGPLLPALLPAGEKYMLYAPHSGFSNQVGELRNALLLALLLNRTLVLPPIFDHHAVALGSCPKFRVHEPFEMRALAWAHITELIRGGRYLAVADVLDLSLVVPLVKLIDLRIFSLLWCGVDIISACSGSLCRSLAAQSMAWGTFESCGALLSRPDEVHGSCVYGVNEDCRTTIWVHNAGNFGSLQKRQSLGAPKLAAASIVDQGVGKNGAKAKYGRRSYKEAVETLGSNSEASKYQVLSFGSLFSAEYKGSQLHVDLESSKDPKVRTLVKAMKFIPFTRPIVNAGKLYSRQRIKKPFFCAQVRLLDGQFKNHWEKTFTSLRSQLEVARERLGPPMQVLNVFVMTDLPHSSWNKTYLGELDVDKSYKLHILAENDPIVRETALELAKDDHGLRIGYLPPLNKTSTENLDPVTVRVHPDILLFVEEIICSCASLGFVGTSGSTLSENILQLRLGNTCTINNDQ